MGADGFLFKDLRLSTAVTVTGRYAIQHVGNHVNRRLNKLLGTTTTNFLVYSDTDSCFFELAPFVDKYFSGKTDAQITNALVTLYDKKIGKFVDEATDEIQHRMNVYEKSLSMKREKVASGFWCVHPSTNISTSIGDVNIAKLFDSCLPTGDVRYVDDLNCTSVSDSGENETDTITHVMRKHYSGYMYTITTPDGTQIKITEDHKVKIIRDYISMWVKAKELKESDTLIFINR